ncbi:xanthine dehydrogenase family protein subunit M [soil metagenome]
MNTFEWANATSVDDAIALLKADGAAIKAGGVDLLDLMKEHLASPTRVVNIRTIRDLDYIKLDGNTLRIGPLVTLAKLADDATVKEKFAALAQAAGHAATPQIRNMATVGGNILQRPRCWYFRNELFNCRKKGGEICYAQEGENQYHAIFNNGLCAIVHPSATSVALVAMGASIELTGADSKKRVMKLEEFFVLPSADLHRENSIRSDELITEIRVPAMPASARSIYIKQGEKESFDWPIAEIAAVLVREGDRCVSASIVLGAAAPVPHRATQTETALVGQKIDETLVRTAAAAALKDATPLANNRYKLALFQTLIEQAVLSAAGVAS